MEAGVGKDTMGKQRGRMGEGLSSWKLESSHALCVFFRLNFQPRRMTHK